MKIRLLLSLVACLSCSSCASVDWSNPEAVRPLAAVATAAYVAEGGDYLERVSREVTMRVAAEKIREVALSTNPTAEAAALALEQVSIDPAYRAAAQSLVRLFAPRLEAASETRARVVLVSIADGIDDIVPAPQK